MRHAHIFGARWVYLVPIANCDKLDNHTRDCYFVSVLPHGDGVKVLDITTRKTVKTCDAFFEESINQPEITSQLPKRSPLNDNATAWLYPETHYPPDQEPELPVDEQQPPEPIRQRPRRDHIIPERYSNLWAHSASLDKSPTYWMAMASSERESWDQAMNVEIKNFINRKVFTLVPRPTGRKIISRRWQLKKKLNPDGSIIKYKARLVAQGFTQNEGIDYHKTFAPLGRQESLKAFLAVNGHRDWEVIQLDVVGAFLYGDLNEEVYLSQPKGFVAPNSLIMSGA